VTPVIRTARKIWQCHGCDGHFAPGTPRAYVQGQTEEGRPITVHLCPICLPLSERWRDEFPMRDPEDDEPGRCSQWNMVGRGRRMMRAAFHARMVGRATTVPEAMAECAAFCARTPYPTPLGRWYWMRHDQALARIPGPLAEC
jgi:hypothetical protein